MTSHELARRLLAGPDLPVIHWSGSCEDKLEEVTEIEVNTQPTLDHWDKDKKRITRSPRVELS